MSEYKEMWTRYFDFGGTSTVREYWMAQLVHLLISIAIGVFVYLVPQLSFLSTVYTLAMVIPNMSLFFRRLRDAGKSWAYMFIVLIPLVGSILLLVTLCSRGTSAYRTYYPTSYSGTNSGPSSPSSAKYCTACGTQHNRTADRCNKCGRSFALKATTPETYCFKCGQKFSAWDTHCFRCHTKRGGMDQPASQAPAPGGQTATETQTPAPTATPEAAPKKKFCVGCGNPIDPALSFCPSCGTKQPKAEVFCSKCGRKLNKEDAFCPGCGTQRS